ncbi:MAG: hypothetical protein FD163_1505 [Hyphomonadaceae bacterium]|nr:MAG: hypothetical protein FD128_277 [Hyphomonadaceae bacterium]KAF0184808.1 MAG: hypothetical protein FD163_1505 [Hyphomonadaceae bacterium]
MLDKSINPYRDDLAAIKLKGMVNAPKYVEPQTFQIVKSAAPILAKPAQKAEQISEALCGEIMEVYDVSNGFAWGQLVKDQYVGYVSIDAICNNIVTTTHKVKVLRTYGFENPNVKTPIIGTFSLGAEVCATGETANGFANCGVHGWIHETHLSEIGEYASDPIAIAKWFLKAPYLWGGKQSFGLDCSGLTQIAFAACGINLPRDSRLQETIGENIEFDGGLHNLRAGDLVFWQGHVAMLIDDVNIIHANAYHMMVEIEPLSAAKERSDASGIALRTISRIL